MNRSCFLCVCVLVAAAVGVAADRAPSPKTDVNIVGEVFAAAPVAPTAAQPVYYVLQASGPIELGDSVKSREALSAAAVTQALGNSLAAAHFLPAGAGHPPALLLVAHWGILRPDRMEIQAPYEIRNSLRARIAMVAAPDAAKRIEYELTERRYGPNLPGQELRLSLADRDALEFARDSHYFVVVTAFDYAAAAEARVVPVWRLRVSTDERRKSLVDAIPAIIHHGSPYFGQRTVEAIRTTLPLQPAAGPMRAAPAAASALAPGFLEDLQKREMAVLSGVKDVPVVTTQP